LAQQFGLNRHAIRRHLEFHVSEAFKRAVKIGPHQSEDELRKLLADNGRSVVENLQALYSGYAARWLANLEAGADGALIAIGREMREVLQLRAKISKELAPSPNLALHTHFGDPRFDALRRALLDYAEAHPEARHDLAPILRAALAPPEGGEEPLNITPRLADAVAA
jgi:hypothetical protein